MIKDQDRKLAAILFVDVVGYTALMQSNEEKAAHTLKFFQKTIKEKVQTQNGRIVNFYGDGVLVIFDTPLLAMQFAIKMQKTFQSNDVPVRIGVHSGPVVFDEDQIYGDSVNLASRIESMGIAGSVLFSERVRRDIKNHPEFQVKSLGFFNFKNVEEPMEVLALANEGLALPSAFELKGKIKEKSSNNIWKIFPWLLLLVLASGAFWYYTTSSKASTNANSAQKFISYLPTDGTTIAVLPFTNLSDEKTNQYFCDGMMEDILLNLAKVKSLKVISRTSVLKYRDTDKSMPDIASELGVDYLVEGSVRRAGDQAKITVQLIHGTTDHHQWAGSYTNRLGTEDIFETQGVIAESIVKEVQATLSIEESKSLYTRPTLSQKAYDHLLKGRNKGWSAEEQGSAIPLFKAAIKEDPSFAEAYINLSRVYRQQWTHFGQSKAYLDSALTVFHKVESMHPNHSIIFEEKASLLFIQGHLQEALPFYIKAVELNPNNFEAINNLGWINISMGNYPESLRWANTFYHRAKNTTWNGSWTTQTIHVYLEISDTAKVKKLLDQILPKPNQMNNRELNILAFRLALLQQNKERALELARKMEDVHLGVSLRFYAFAYHWFEEYDKAIPYYNKYMEAHPGANVPEEFIGELYFHTGKKDTASIMFIQKEQDILEKISSGNQNMHQRLALAKIHAIQGKDQSAISWLEKAFENGYCNELELKESPQFDSLRAYPEFKALLQKMSDKIQLIKKEIDSIQLDYL